MKSWAPFEWIAATRFLGEGRMQTAFILAGAAIGVAVIVFMSALIAGMQANTLRRSLLSQPHIVVRAAEEVARPLRAGAGVTPIVQKRSQRLVSIDQWERLLPAMRAIPGVNVASATVAGPAFAVRGEANKPVTINGIEPDEFTRIVPLRDKIVTGAFRLTTTDALIGIELARDLGVGVGDKLRLTLPRGASATLTITGLFDLGSRGANERNVYVPMRTAQDLLGLPGGASAIDVTVHDVWEAEAIAQRIAAAVGLQADSWIRTNQQFFTALNAQTIANMVLRISIGLAVAMGIASVLAVSVVQRSREIGILRAMGATRAQVMRIFLIQGGLVGLAGSLAGTAIAAFFMQVWQRMLRNPDGTPLFMVGFDPAFIAWAAGIATLTGLLAAVMPARRAARLDPVVAIRA